MATKILFQRSVLLKKDVSLSDEKKEEIVYIKNEVLNEETKKGKSKPIKKSEAATNDQVLISKDIIQDEDLNKSHQEEE